MSAFCLFYWNNIIILFYLTSSFVSFIFVKRCFGSRFYFWFENVLCLASGRFKKQVDSISLSVAVAWKTGGNECW